MGCRPAETVGDRSPSIHPPSGHYPRFQAPVPCTWITTVQGTLRDHKGAQILFATAGAERPSKGHESTKANRNLTEFSIRPMLSSHLKEVHVNKAAKKLTIAVLTTIADAAVVVWYGGVIWRALSPIIWSRILILLLATLWALSLARVWARAINSLRQMPRTRSFDLSPGTAMTSIDLRREGDV
jgi:hypothetical protein